MGNLRFMPEGTLLKDCAGHWWILKKYCMHSACESFIKMESYDKKADGSIVIVNLTVESLENMKEVTTAEKVLYGKT